MIRNPKPNPIFSKGCSISVVLSSFRAYRKAASDLGSPVWPLPDLSGKVHTMLVVHTPREGLGYHPVLKSFQDMCAEAGLDPWQVYITTCDCYDGDRKVRKKFDLWKSAEFGSLRNLDRVVLIGAPSFAFFYPGQPIPRKFWAHKERLAGRDINVALVPSTARMTPPSGIARSTLIDFLQER